MLSFNFGLFSSIQMFTRKTFHVVGLTSLLFLSACATVPEQAKMNEETRAHPATKRFFEYSAASKEAESFKAMLPEFYTAITQKRIASLKGWYKLSYSSAYQFLKQGECNRIEKKQISSRRVQLDCIGPLVVGSVILPDRTESAHLRAFLELRGDQWFFDKAGYAHVNSLTQPPSFSRYGMRFSSDMEKQVRAPK